MMNRDFINHVAIKSNGVIYAMPKPNRHWNVIKMMNEKYQNKQSWGSEVQGFLTESGKFLEREEAKKHAIAVGQIQSSEHDELFSEDLW